MVLYFELRVRNLGRNGFCLAWTLVGDYRRLCIVFPCFYTRNCNHCFDVHGTGIEANFCISKKYQLFSASLIKFRFEICINKKDADPASCCLSSSPNSSSNATSSTSGSTLSDQESLHGVMLKFLKIDINFAINMLCRCLQFY